jgi:DNA replication licensing factor MCM2
LLTFDNVKREVGLRFRRFLSGFKDKSAKLFYLDRIDHMAQENRESLEISYLHLISQASRIAVWLAECPTQMLEILDEEATNVVRVLYPAYDQIHPKIHVRIQELPISDPLRELRQVHLNALIKTSGVVTRRTNILPQLMLVKYNCVRCGYLLGPFLQTGEKEVTPGSCPECQSKGPFSVNQEQTVYRNYQKITIQESPGSVPPGRVPRTKDVILLYDLIDQVRPGEEVEVTGVYTHNFDTSLNTKNGFPVFSTVIEANYLSKSEGLSSRFALTDEDTTEIHRLAQLPDIFDRIVRSMAPSIYGHDDIKTAVTLALFGGEAIEFRDKPRQRGDINVLILGDPGTAKSQFLKYVEKTSHRAVYTTGKGASAVGLTASVHIDHLTREWTLEGGALVLADKGVCLIDEFDKMNDQDRTSIHEAMEQQTISISKAGIVTSLQARCSVIAAANPIGGRYDSQLTFSENVELTDPILSRFDVLCVVRDTVDPVEDERLASYVVSSHVRSHPNYTAAVSAGDAGVARAGQMGLESEETRLERERNSVPQDLLRKYILYARTNCHPKLDQIDSDKIAKLYVDLRQQSMVTGAVPIAVRHIQSIIRLAQAHAKVHLRDRVRDDDVDLAIRVMLESFINAQKHSIMRSLRRQFAHYVTYRKDHNVLVLHLLLNLMREAQRFQQARGLPSDEVAVECEELEAKARELNIHQLQSFYQSEQFVSNGFALDAAAGNIVKRFDEMVA